MVVIEPFLRRLILFRGQMMMVVIAPWHSQKRKERLNSIFEKKIFKLKNLSGLRWVSARLKRNVASGGPPPRDLLCTVKVLPFFFAHLTEVGSCQSTPMVVLPVEEHIA